MNFDEINHISYAVSYKELVSIWVDLYFQTENIVIIYDPISHLDYIRELEVEMDELNLYESKILVVHMVNIFDATSLCESIDHTVGPYAEVWSEGKFLMDNLEN